MAHGARWRCARLPGRRYRLPSGRAQRVALTVPRSHASIRARAARPRRTRGSRDDSEPLAAINAAADALPPAAIGEIPLDGLAQPGLEALLRRPVEVGRDFRSINRIAQIVSRAIRHERDQRAPRPDLRIRYKLVHQRADRLDDLQVRPLAISADAIGVADRSFQRD